MIWLPLIFITSLLSSSGATGVLDHGRPITFYSADNFYNKRNFSVVQEFEEEVIDDSTSDNSIDDQDPDDEDPVYIPYDDSGIRSDINDLKAKFDEVSQHTQELRVIEKEKETLLTYICGIILFFLICVILKYIYKFFNIFF